MPLIDPDIRKAETLPSRFYTDSATFEQVRSGFSRNWHFAAHLSQLKEFNVTGFLPMRSLGERPKLSGPTLTVRAGRRSLSFTEGYGIQVQVRDVDFLRLQVLLELS